MTGSDGKETEVDEGKDDEEEVKENEVTDAPVQHL